MVIAPIRNGFVQSNVVLIDKLVLYHRCLLLKLEKQLCSHLAVKFCSKQGIFTATHPPPSPIPCSLQEMASRCPLESVCLVFPIEVYDCTFCSKKIVFNLLFSYSGVRLQSKTLNFLQVGLTVGVHIMMNQNCCSHWCRSWIE